jgi:hypothetical protein
LIQEIKRKVKNPIKGSNEFVTDDAVVDVAVQQLYEQLKQQRVL